MRIMKKFIILAILLLLTVISIDIVVAKSVVRTVLLKKCPSKTTSLSNLIIFVGKLDDLGNDKYVNVWFEFGNKNLDKQTPMIKLKKPGIFCLRVNNLKKCENYHYRAVAKNIKGIAYGEIKKIKTKCK